MGRREQNKYIFAPEGKRRRGRDGKRVRLHGLLLEKTNGRANKKPAIGGLM